MLRKTRRQAEGRKLTIIAAVATFAILIGMGSAATSASALVDSEPIYKDVEITKSALSSNSTLSDFSELTSQQKLAIERVFGDPESKIAKPCQFLHLGAMYRQPQNTTSKHWLHIRFGPS